MTYADVAAELEITTCSHCDTEILHERGVLRQTPDGVVLHWRERPVNIVGLRRFLLFAARMLNPEIERREAWERLWLVNVIAAQLALKRFHRRFPRHMAERDRARERYLLRNVEDWRKRQWDDHTKSAFKQATRWAWEY